jgi:hypothetical protein
VKSSACPPKDSFQEVGGDWICFVQPAGVDVGVVVEVSSLGVLGDVSELMGEVFSVSDAVLVEAGLPDSACEFCGKGVGEAAFDALGATFDSLIYGGS